MLESKHTGIDEAAFGNVCPETIRWRQHTDDWPYTLIQWQSLMVDFGMGPAANQWRPRHLWTKKRADVLQLLHMHLQQTENFIHEAVQHICQAMPCVGVTMSWTCWFGKLSRWSCESLFAVFFLHCKRVDPEWSLQDTFSWWDVRYLFKGSLYDFDCVTHYFLRQYAFWRSHSNLVRGTIVHKAFT